MKLSTLGKVGCFMKKIVTLILAMVMLLSLCACGNDVPATTAPTTGAAPVQTSPNTTASTPTTKPTEPPVTEPKEPTQEEMDAMWEYAHIAVALEEYLANGYIFYSVYDDDGNVVQSLRDQEALDYCYQQLAAMEGLDRWLGTEFSEGIHWHDVTPSWDRVGVLSKFRVLPDRKLRQDYVLTKKDGTTEKDTESSWEYDADGNLIAIDGIRDMFETVQSVPVFPGNFTVYFSYHADGSWSQILYGSNGYATGTPTYDASGNIISISMVSRDDSCTVQYTYSGNLVTKIEWTEYGNPVKIEYTYDGSGNVTQSVYTEYTGTDNMGNNLYPRQRIIFDYTYNGSQLSGATRTEEISNWDWDENNNYVFFVELRTVDTYSFSYDEMGRLSTIDITYGDSIWAHGDKAGTLCREAEYLSKQIMLVYGGYYFYVAE